MNPEMLPLSLALPAAMLLGCLSAGLRKMMLRGLWIAPVPALGAALFSTRNSPVVLSGEPYHVTLMLDASGSMLLTAASLLWIAAGFYVPAFFRGRAMTGSFTVCWLFTLIGSLGIFLAADLVSFFLCYALVSLPAYGLVTYDGTPVARRAGAIYMGFALLGENLLLMGFVLLAANTPDGSLRIADAVDALQAAPSRTAILSLLIVGFGMKIALLPMHFWMPLSYTASPIPAAAVLSGAAVKAGVIGLIRFLPFDMTLPGWGELLTIVGFFGAFYGVVVGITQSNPKTVLAYSSVSQMGFLAAVLGMGLSTGDASVAPLAAFYAAHHVLVKGALVPFRGRGRADGCPPHGPRAGTGNDDCAGACRTSAHRRRPGETGGERSARLRHRRDSGDAFRGRHCAPDDALFVPPRRDGGPRTKKTSPRRTLRPVAGDGCAVPHRSLGVVTLTPALDRFPKCSLRRCSGRPSGPWRVA